MSYSGGCTEQINMVISTTQSRNGYISVVMKCIGGCCARIIPNEVIYLDLDQGCSTLRWRPDPGEPHRPWPCTLDQGQGPILVLRSRGGGGQCGTLEPDSSQVGMLWGLIQPPHQPCTIHLSHGANTVNTTHLDYSLLLRNYFG